MGGGRRASDPKPSEVAAVLTAVVFFVDSGAVLGEGAGQPDVLPRRDGATGLPG